MDPRIRRLAYSGGLVAAAFALKYPLVGIPNVEPLTLAFFAIGYVYGPLWGVFVGALGEGLYATLNPMGMTIPPVLVAQILGMACAGGLGGLWARWFGRRIPRPRFALISAVGGVLVTLVFDLVTNLAFAWAIGPFWVVLVAAVPFALIHVGSNALLFALIFPILEQWLMRPPTVVTGSQTSS